jgi:pimeloyl-ACP methyl ester carboxylesterase
MFTIGAMVVTEPFEHAHFRLSGVAVHAVSMGMGPLVLFCHGFPETWYSWRHQLRAVADAGFRAMALDVRGYGTSNAPPDNVSLEHGALVVPMSVAYHAATLSDMAVGDSAIVFGAGPIGIGAWHALRGRDIDDVHVVEPSKARRLAINALGAKTLDPMIDDVAAFVADHTHGAGVGAVFETAGARATIESALGLHSSPRCCPEHRHVREACLHTAAQCGFDGMPHPRFVLLHRRRLRGSHRPDGTRRLRHRRLGDDDRSRRRGE